ncbi:MAG: ankyrin repeat domain-containing protein [Bacteroidetes bacterium]|nr:MAG: ankyrin repeat domain-containing protein [Bacteroidota bacterium]
MVKEYVGKAHNDLGRVREILDEHPLILNAAWDWGDGDFETALGAAGHVGFRDMALFLLDKGARADIFVLTMLGETAIVKALVERYPALLTSIGPHGFTLLHHAKRGGEQAQDLLDFFTEKGLAETYIDIFGKKKK